MITGRAAPPRLQNGGTGPNLSRLKMIKTRTADTAGVAGLGLAARIADDYGLIPPDHAEFGGLGENAELRFREAVTGTEGRERPQPDFLASAAE